MLATEVKRLTTLPFESRIASALTASWKVRSEVLESVGFKVAERMPAAISMTMFAPGLSLSKQ